jgi:hypothetical protein
MSRDQLLVLNACRVAYNHRFTLMNRRDAVEASGRYSDEQRLLVLCFTGNRRVSIVSRDRLRCLNDEIARLSLACKIKLLKWLVAWRALYDLYYG